MVEYNHLDRQEILLSIIVPVYNVEKYLRDCLDSLLEQDLDKRVYEIICVNDGSKDSSGEILDEYAIKTNNIRVVHKKNEGVSVARNIGLDLARGEYVHFVDPDDYFYPHTYGQLIDIAKKEGADVILFDYGKISMDTEYKNSSFPYLKLKEKLQIHSGIQISAMVWRNIIKRNLIEDNHIRFLRGVRYYEDTCFEDVISCYATKIIKIKADLYFYRQGIGVTAKTNEQSLLQRAQDCYLVAKELQSLRNSLQNKQIRKYLKVRISENVASSLLLTLHCSKGIAKKMQKELIKDELYPYSTACLLGKLKKNKKKITLILVRYRLFFLLFDKFNIFRR